MLLKQLENFLEKRINQTLSAKMKLSFESNISGYFQEREQIEGKVILETNWLSYFSEYVTTETEFEDPKFLDDSDLLTFHQITIEALKRFIDAHRETETLCNHVLAVYRDTKTELEKRFPEFPRGDGFTDYLEARTEREVRDSARITGSMCPNCGSTDISSYGDKWRCRTCQKLWRKR
jgi:predicted RNA-binding Zn-ribbon protein involved in translation (DUF1610 family)